MPGLTGHLPPALSASAGSCYRRLRFRRPGGLREGERWPGGSVRWRSLRTLPPFPASPLRGNLSPAGPVFLWPRGGHAPGHLPLLLPSRAGHSGNLRRIPALATGVPGRRAARARAHRTRLARSRRAPLSHGGGACLGSLPSRGSCTRMHLCGLFCTCGYVPTRCYEQNRPPRSVFVHDPPD